jgi:hypothetical protein
MTYSRKSHQKKNTPNTCPPHQANFYFCTSLVQNFEKYPGKKAIAERNGLKIGSI